MWNPYWVQLTRSGNNFTASRSADGVIWTPIGSATVTMGSTVYVGLATTGADNNQLNTSSFHNVSVTTGSVTAPAAPTALSGAVVTNRRIDLSWVDNASNETAFFLERATNSSFTQNLATDHVGFQRNQLPGHHRGAEHHLLLSHPRLQHGRLLRLF